jgi:hypothetical protein
MQVKQASIIAIVMAVAALLSNHVFGRIPIGESKPVPIAEFPRIIGDWKAGPDIPVTEDVKRFLPTSKIVQRVYRNNKGEAVELLLLTSTVMSDFHDPETCLRSQGWTVAKKGDFNLDNRNIICINAQYNDHPISEMYWFDGDYASRRSHPQIIKSAYEIRSKISRLEEGTNIFVRIISENDKDLTKAKQFIHLIQQPLSDMQKSVYKTG